MPSRKMTWRRTQLQYILRISFEMQDALATRITFLEQKNHEKGMEIN